jgi:hypothetical protein
MRRSLGILFRRKNKCLTPVSIAQGLGFVDPLQTRLQVRRREEALYLK